MIKITLKEQKKIKKLGKPFKLLVRGNLHVPTIPPSKNNYK